MKFTYTKKNAKGFKNVTVSYIWHGDNLLITVRYKNTAPNYGIHSSLSGGEDEIGLMLNQHADAKLNGIWIKFLPENDKERKLFKHSFGNVISCDYIQTTYVLTPSDFNYDNMVDAEAA